MGTYRAIRTANLNVENLDDDEGRLHIGTAYQTGGVYQAAPRLAGEAAMSLRKVNELPLRENFAWTLAGNAIYAACQWGILVTIAKFGTPAMLGQFALGLALAAPVFMLTSLQLRAVLVTDSRDQYRLGHYLAPRLLGTAVGLLVIAVFLLASRFHGSTAIVVLLVALAKAVDTLSDLIYGFWQKHERFDKIAIALIQPTPARRASADAECIG